MGRRGKVAEGSEPGGEPEKRPKFEVDPPKRAKCPNCGGERLRVAYTTVFRESGFRRITADCADCGAICWWDALLESKKI
jgi:transcription elongation factor Elf1